jgi:hypothetical protein
MRKFALAFLAVSLLTTGAAFACGTFIHDLQVNSPAGIGTLVTPCGAIITAVRPDGIYVSQVPHGAWDAIFVYWPGHTYFGGAVAAPGDVVDICGEFKEVCGLSTVDIPAAGLYGSVIKTGTAPIPAVNYVTAAALLASPEQWESVTIMITDGMSVPAGYSLGSGMWNVEALDGTTVVFDDFWYNFGNVMEGQCYNNATGILHDACGSFLFEPFLNGIPVVNCSVGIESVSMGSIKARYR